MQLCSVYGKFNFALRTRSLHYFSAHNWSISKPTCFAAFCTREVSMSIPEWGPPVKSNIYLLAPAIEGQLNAFYEERKKVKDTGINQRKWGWRGDCQECFAGGSSAHLNTAGPIVSCGSENLWSSSSCYVPSQLTEGGAPWTLNSPGHQSLPPTSLIRVGREKWVACLQWRLTEHSGETKACPWGNA